MSKTKYVLVATTAGSGASYSASLTAKELNVLKESPVGALAALDNTQTILTFPKLHFLAGKGATYAPEVCVIPGNMVQNWKSVAYSAGYKQWSTVGYDGISTENCPVNVYNDYDYTLRLSLTDVENTTERESGPGSAWTVRSGYNANSAAHGRYNTLRDLVEQINLDADNNFIAKLRHSETILALTMDVVVVNGSTTVTGTALASTAVTGTFLCLAGDIYKVVDTSGTTTCILDRNFAGASGTIEYNQATSDNWTMIAGSTTATSDGAHGYTGAKNFIFDNVYYAATYVSATVYLLDHPYEGSDTSLTANATPAAGAATLGAAGYVAGATVDDATLFGIEITTTDTNQTFFLSIESGFDGDEVIVDQNAVSFSSGTYAEVLASETGVDQKAGELNSQLSRTSIVTNATSGVNYAKYIINFYKQSANNMGGVHSEECELIIWMATTVGSTLLYDYVNDWLISPGTGGSGAFSDV